MIGEHTGRISRPGHNESAYAPLVGIFEAMNPEARLKIIERVGGTIGAIAMLAGLEQDHGALITGGLVGVVLSASSALLRKFH